jgi:hypothetical protein
MKETDTMRKEKKFTYLPMKMEQSVPKRRHIKFRRREITQKKTYNLRLYCQSIVCFWRQPGNVFAISE